MNKFMQMADQLAKQNILTDNGGPFGAVVVKNGIIVGVGNNHVVKHKDPTAHAEIMAIRNACKTLRTFDLRGCELYTSCYPCPMCLAAIIWANIRVVYYGNTAKDAADIGFRDDMIYNYLQDMTSEESRNLLQLHMMDRDETIEAFAVFKDKEEKTMY